MMKKMIFMFAIIFTANTAFAQVEKTIKDTYVLNGDKIEATLYHSNGEIAQTGFYTIDNKLDGEWVSYDSNGNKTAMAKYEDGQKVGTWTFFQGDEKKEVTYLNSEIAEVKTWKVSDTRVVSN